LCHPVRNKSVVGIDSSCCACRFFRARFLAATVTAGVVTEAVVTATATAAAAVVATTTFEKVGARDCGG
jgi:hypothetical protein